MQRYIAFLRGINVGGHNVKMETLRSAFAALGFANVATFIASGNIIFEAHANNAYALEQRIEEHLLQTLGYDVPTFIRSVNELAAIASYQAFPLADVELSASSLYVVFLRMVPPDAVREKLVTLSTPSDDFHQHEREIYWLCRTRLSESPLFSGGLLEKTVNVPLTMRNITTVRKLAAKYGGHTHDA